jgi:hypothetical protein
MRQVVLALASVMLAVSALACCCFPVPVSLPNIDLPDVQIDVPRVEVGALEEYDEEIPLDEVDDEARVEVRFGAGVIDVGAGDEDTFFRGHFRTNVAVWAPEVTWEDDSLLIEQGTSEGIPDSDDMVNEWELLFSPEVPMELDLNIGASEGTLDLTGLALTDFSLDTGASDLDVRFDEPNPVEMEDLDIRAGAASLAVEGIGNASPERMLVEGGVGELLLDFTGDWARSARVRVTAGAGALTLRLPEDVGVWVEVEGFGTVEADSGLVASGDTYINQAYGEAETELLIEVTVGVGSIDLELVGE